MTPPSTRIDPAAVTAALTAERLALCDLLDRLAPDDWAARSLCPAWTVHDVVAHLTLVTTETRWETVTAVVRARGSFDRMNIDTARAHAARLGPDDLVRVLRANAASARRAPLSSPLDPLLDLLVHGQDIARPIERVHPMAPDHVVLVLDHAITSRWYGGAKRFTDLTLAATDTGWSFGSGDLEVRGSAGDLLLTATGRAAGLEGLTGSGVDALATALG